MLCYFKTVSASVKNGFLGNSSLLNISWTTCYLLHLQTDLWHPLTFWSLTQSHYFLWVEISSLSGLILSDSFPVAINPG
jgi:hypothetical protein